jgi:hypothetical protein
MKSRRLVIGVVSLDLKVAVADRVMSVEIM